MVPAKSKNAPTPEAREKLLVIADWIEVVRSEVEDIRGWRDAEPSDRLHQFWTPLRAQNRGVHQSTMPGRLFGWTVSLRAWIRELSPKDDTECIQDVYQAVFAWHNDHNAEQLPPQNELDSTLERAVSLVLMLRAQLERKGVGATAPNAGGPSGSLEASISRTGSEWKIVYGEEEGVFRDLQPIRVLRELVSRPFPKQPIPAAEILGEGVAPPVPTEPVLDDDAREHLRKRAKELGGVIQEARSAGDFDEVRRHTTELQVIEEKLNASVGFAGREAQLQVDKNKSPAERVARAIKIARAGFEKHGMPALSAHLHASLKRESGCWSYLPPPPAPNWEV